MAPWGSFNGVCVLCVVCAVSLAPWRSLTGVCVPCVLCVLCWCDCALLFRVVLSYVVGFVDGCRVFLFVALFLLVLCGAQMRRAVWCGVAWRCRPLRVVLCCAGLAC